MSGEATHGRFAWTVVLPVAALAALVATWGRKPADVVLALVAWVAAMDAFTRSGENGT